MLVGFKADNHPQQVGTRGALDEVDDRATHPDDFAGWNAELGPFTLDAAAAPHNAKVAKFYTRADNGLEQSWAGERVWCNPPYSGLGDWLAKAWTEWPTSRGIVMLLPANRVEQKWWQEHVEPKRDRPGSPLTVRFLPGRLRFIKAGATAIKPNERPPFGCALLIWADPAQSITATDEREALARMIENYVWSGQERLDEEDYRVADALLEAGVRLDNLRTQADEPRDGGS